MKSCVWYGPGDVRYEESPLPVLEEGEALIKVSRAGICGSDLTIYGGHHRRAKPPLIMGHEFGGEIVEVRSRDSDLRPGDPVAVEPLLSCGHCYVCKEGSYYACSTLGLLGIDANGGFAEYAKAAVDRIYKLPPSLPMELATMVEPAAVAVHTVRRSRVRVGTHAVVVGGGPIGLLVAQVARLASGTPVELAEVSDWRLNLARKLGFDPIDSKKEDLKEAVLARTEGRGADVFFDAAGAAAIARLFPAVTRVHGQIVQVAHPHEFHPVDLAGLALKEIDFTGVRVYDYNDYKTAIALIAAGKIDVKSMVSHELPLEKTQEGLELAKKGDASMKILLKP